MSVFVALEKGVRKNRQLNLFSALINKADYLKTLTIKNILYNFLYLYDAVHENIVSTYLSFNF